MVLLFDFSRVILFPKEDNYSGSLNELYKVHKDELNFNFFSYFKLNDELISYLNSIKATTNLYMFTSDVIQDAPELQPTVISLFKEVFSASKMATSKTVPESYKMIAESLRLQIGEIVYIDDSEANIKTASSAGLHTIQYVSNENLFSKLKEYVPQY